MTWTPAVLIPVNTALLNRIDDGASTGPAALNIYNDADTLLVSLPLTDPAGSVNGTTGALTLTPGDPATPVATGTADHADLVDNDGAVLKEDIPLAQGTSSVAGSVVLSSLAIDPAFDVTLVSISVA